MHLQQTTYLSYSIYFLSPLPIVLFTFLVATAVADYLNDRVEGETPYIWGRERCVLEIAKFFFVIGDEIGSLLEHLPLPKEQIFSIVERDR